MAPPLDISRASVSYWEAGKTDIPKATAMAMEMIYGIAATWLLSGEGPMWAQRAAPNSASAILVPIIEGTPTCGPGGEVQDPGPDTERYPFSPSFIQEVLRQCGSGAIANLFLAQVSGDSMRPTILPGDLVLVNNDLELRTKPRKAALYLVRRSVESEEARVKRVFFTPGGNLLTLQSDNTAYEKITVPIDGLRLQDLILGKVCWYGRHLQDVVPPHEDW